MLSKYVPQQLPQHQLQLAQNNENARIKLSLDSIIAVLIALEVPIQIGPADSAGVGFRTLRIPN